MLRRSLRALKSKVMSSADALKDIKDGASIAVGGFGFCGLPFELLSRLHLNGKKNLHIVTGTLSGNDTGYGPLIKDGQVDKITAAYVGENDVFYEHLVKGKLHLELCPMGTLVERIRCGGAGIPGFYTPTGFGTALSTGDLPARFAPDGSGRVVECTPPRETRLFKDRWCSLEEAIVTDFSFVKAWKADTKGNLVFRGTARNLNDMIATCGRTCIAEVEEIVEAGELDMNHIHVPSVYVDRIVRPKEIVKRVERVVIFAGDEAPTTPKEMDIRRQRIARRAARELQDGMQVNLGIGIPTMVPTYVPPTVKIDSQTEIGMLFNGRYPKSESEVDADFTNAGKQSIVVTEPGASIFDSSRSFAMIRGCHMDLTLLGAFEVSGSGDLASWYLPGKTLKGMGGAMDLVSSGCKTIVLLEHVNGKGKSRIVKKCALPITGKGVVSMIITDLAVFDVVQRGGTARHLLLKELAEGVTIEEVRAKTEADFFVADQVTKME